MVIFRALAVIAASVVMVSAAGAASVSYDLKLSSDDLSHISNTGFVTGNIPSGTTYATVTIDDDGAPDLINFTVSLSPFWTGKADTNFGISSFGFNVAEPEEINGLATSDIISLPTDWSADVDYTGPPGPVGITQNGYGKFDAVVFTDSNPPNRLGTLAFSIDNAFSSDAIEDYIAGSIAGLNGSHFFAVKIAGFVDQNPLDPVDGGNCPSTPDANIEDCNLLNSVWVAGSTPMQVIPVPAAVWLFGSALGLLGWIRRRPV